MGGLALARVDGGFCRRHLRRLDRTDRDRPDRELENPAAAYILVTLVAYVAILAVTFVYFVPEPMATIQTGLHSNGRCRCDKKADLWETLSLVRLGG